MKDLFLSPFWLGASLGSAILAISAAWFSARRARSRREGLVAPALAEKAGLLSRDRWTGAAASLAVIVVLGTGLALARPRWGLVTETVERRGADVAIVLDTSASMRATDVTPSRFVLARQAALSLVEKLPGDRLALVGCEGEAQVLVPLTLDSAAVALFLEALEPGIGTLPGTSLAAGLAAAAELMPPGTSAGRQVVVLSDGEDLEGGVDEAIAKAKGEGIVVHAVFVGAEGRGAPVPEVDLSGRSTGFKSEDGAPVLSRPDPGLLRRLAAETGGSFSVVQPGRTDLDGVAREVDKAARRPLSESVGTNRHERFQIPLGIAVAALALLLVGPLGFLVRRPRKTAAALVGIVALALVGTPVPLLGQTVPPAGAAAPGLSSPSPSTPPAPPAPASLKERILSRPPFTTARGEAIAGKKALEEKRVDEAVSRFARETALDPKDPSGAYNLGTALSKAGRGEEALAALRKAKGASRGDLAADAAFNSGNVLLEGKQWEAAAAAYRDALRARPGEADAAWNYELALRRLDQQKKQQQQQKQQQQGGPPPPPKKDDFEKKAKMSRDKAEQLLQAIARNDLEEQRKKVAEQKKQRRAGRDW
ncbi:MAG TPA: VWA domain-containing protein [Thermoanaerobaculia bacterium]|nr:VWA domain-containing protein [Thermoanaerobaculia bacterium]